VESAEWGEEEGDSGELKRQLKHRGTGSHERNQIENKGGNDEEAEWTIAGGPAGSDEGEQWPLRGPKTISRTGEAPPYARNGCNCRQGHGKENPHGYPPERS